MVSNTTDSAVGQKEHTIFCMPSLAICCKTIPLPSGTKEWVAGDEWDIIREGKSQDQIWTQEWLEHQLQLLLVSTSAVVSNIALPCFWCYHAVANNRGSARQNNGNELTSFISLTTLFFSISPPATDIVVVSPMQLYCATADGGSKGEGETIG